MQNSIECWVANCRSQLGSKSFFPLTTDIKYREIWLALAGKKLAGFQGEIYFCQDHFRVSSMNMYMNKLCLKKKSVPYERMPQCFCRTCMTLIPHDGVFCILSKTIPSIMPPDLKPDLLQCRPEPLYHLLTFCIPELKLEDDPPPVVCYSCYQNIWLYFIYKITSNAVEKGLCGNLTPVEYGKMVLCRSCPQTSGTSFFHLAEDTLMGMLLKRVFLNDYPSDIVPLKVCLKCWNTLYKIKNFYEQCMAADQKMQRHISMSHGTLSSVSEYFPTSAAQLDKSQASINPLRQIRKLPPPYEYATQMSKKDVAFAEVVNQNIVNVTEAGTAAQTSNNIELPCSNSVIKFAGDFKNEKKFTISDTGAVLKKPQPPILTAMSLGLASHLEATASTSKKPEEKYYKNIHTWMPPVINGNPSVEKSKSIIKTCSTVGRKSIALQEANVESTIVNKAASASIPSSSGTESIGTQEVNNFIPAVASTSSITDQDDHSQQNIIEVTESSDETSDNALERLDAVRDFENEYRPLNKTLIDNRSVKHAKTKVRLPAEEKIALARLMMKFGEPLKYKTSGQVQFEAWIKIVKKFHKINDKCSLETIQNTWNWMKKKAELAFEQIGPAQYQDQLVINYLYSYPLDNEMAIDDTTVDMREKDCGALCLDDEIREGDNNIANRERIVKTRVEDGEPPSKVTKIGDNRPMREYTAEVPKKRRGRPKKNQVNETDQRGQKLELALEIKKERDKSLNNKNVSPRQLRHENKESPKIQTGKWDHKQKLELVRAIRKEYDKCLANNELTSRRSPWRMILHRLATQKYGNYAMDKLLYEWTQMRTSATIYEKNGLDVVDEEVWEMLQIQQAIQKSIKCNGSARISGKTINEMIERKWDNRLSSLLSNQAKDTPSSSVSASSDKGEGNNASHKPSVKMSSSPKKKLNTKNVRSYRKDFNCWSEDEKIKLFKLIKQEFNSMVKNKEPVIRPWRKILQRVSLKGYKNCRHEALYSIWSKMQRNARLHENDRQLSMLDCKVIRLLKLANKLKNMKETVIAASTKDDDIDKVITTGKTKPVSGQNSHPETSVPVKHKDKQGIDNVTTTLETVNGATVHADKSDIVGCDSWTLEEKLDLIDVIKSCGNEIFKKSPLTLDSFWSKLQADYKTKGHIKDLEEISSCWHNMHQSAKLAWAQQKETSPSDKVIIEFMTDVIKSRNNEKNGEDEDDSFDEVSDRKNELSSSELEKENDTMVIDDSDDDNLDPQKADDDDDTDVELNYDYVSLSDIEKTCESNSIANKTVPSADVKIETSYVSMKDCAINFPHENVEEVVVIDDSEEE